MRRPVSEYWEVSEVKNKLITGLAVGICVMAAATALNASSARASSGSSLYDALQSLYGGNSQGTSSGGSSYSSGYSSGYGTQNQQSSSDGRGQSFYAINQQSVDAQYQRDISANDVSGNNVVQKRNYVLDSSPIGPTVADISLSELFHENYGVYEERISDAYSVYTNVSNGSITDRPVIFDVPSGVTVSMTRDGKRAEFANRTAIQSEGYYVLMMYIVNDEGLDDVFSKQTVSRAKFRFRIQYDSGIAGYAAKGTAESAAQTEQDFASLLENELAGENEGSDDTDTEMSAEEQIISQSEPAEEEQTQEEPAVVPKRSSSRLDTEYDAESGYYRNILKTGSSFLTNVVNGTVTNGPVMIQSSDTVKYELYKDNEPAEDFTPGEYLTETGSYALYPYEETQDYTVSYGSDRPVLRFRILGGTVNDMGVLTAPENASFTGVLYNGEPADERVFISPTVLRLEQDGTYVVTMNSEAGESDITVNVDNTPPKFDVATEPNRASIRWISDDVENTVLYRGSDLVSDQGIVSVVTDPGRYTITAYDRAGNQSTQSFNVTYRINVAAVIAIIIVIGLAVALIIFLRKIRTDVTVR